ncbi:MAG TPA: hypothetical protein VFE62_26280 [Gemmataceae bacterium]|nr:hypothetical protein [Gemmataceae bacterium]
MTHLLESFRCATIAAQGSCRFPSGAAGVNACLAIFLAFAVTACSGDNNKKTGGTGDTDDSSDNANGSDDSSGDDDSSSSTGADSGSKRDADGSTMRADSGFIDAGKGTTDRSDAAAVDAGGKQDSSTVVSSGECTRDAMKAAISEYFDALTAHDPSMLPLASNVRFTENGETMMLGEGKVWKSAGMQKFKRSALDTESCNSSTESVIPNGTPPTDTVYGFRLKLQGQEITEIETIWVDPQTGWFPNPQGFLSTADDDWETELPPDQRPTRERLQFLVDKYFRQFGTGGCDFGDGCTRFENGFMLPCTAAVSCDPTDPPKTGGVMVPRLYILDVEAGIGVGFVMFAGVYTDFHMFKVRNDKVMGVHAVLASATSSGWDM